MVEIMESQQFNNMESIKQDINNLDNDEIEDCVVSKNTDSIDCPVDFSSDKDKNKCKYSQLRDFLLNSGNSSASSAKQELEDNVFTFEKHEIAESIEPYSIYPSTSNSSDNQRPSAFSSLLLDNDPDLLYSPAAKIAALRIMSEFNR